MTPEVRAAAVAALRALPSETASIREALAERQLTDLLASPERARALVAALLNPDDLAAAVIQSMPEQVVRALPKGYAWGSDILRALTGEADER